MIPTVEKLGIIMVMDFGMIDRQRLDRKRKLKKFRPEEINRDKSVDKRPKRQRSRADIDRSWRIEYDNLSADITQG